MQAGGQRRKDSVIGQVKQGSQRLASGRSLTGAGRRGCAALGRDGRKAGAGARTAHSAEERRGRGTES